MIRRALLSLALCAALPAAARAAGTYAFATATDFLGPGCASWVSLDAPRPAHGCVAPVSSDPVCRWAFGRVYVVNRFGADNVQVLDPASGFATERQFSVGNGTNPQDIAVLSPTKAYVSLLNAPYLLVVDPSAGALLDSIPLGAFADADGLPEAYKMHVHGDRVFVALQRLANFAPTESSLVAVIDAAADTVVDADPALPGVQAIRLTGRNPYTDFVYDAAQGLLLLGEVGEYGVADGGVDRIDPAGLCALGYEATEASLGGELGDIALGPGGEAYMALGGFSFFEDARLVRYDRATGSVTATLFTADGPSLADLEVNDRAELWVCDRSLFAPGLRVFDAVTGAALAGPIDVGAPPFDVCFDAPAVLAADDEAGGGAPAPGLLLLAAGPNPSRGELRVRFAAAGASAAPARLRVFDARGAEVGRVESAAADGPGEHSLCWRAGAKARPGVYFFRLERGAEAAGGKFALVR